MSNEVTKKTEMQKTLDLINEKLAAIKTIQTTAFKTTGMIAPFGVLGFGNSIDIRIQTNINTLVAMLGTLKSQEEEHNAVYEKSLGLTTYPEYKCNNYSFKDWEHDIKLRLSILMQAETTNKLNDAKAKLEQFLTADDRLAIVLNEINSINL